jgi:hypothetical protein
MAASSEVSYKQRAVTEFLLVKNKQVGNIHKSIKGAYRGDAVNQVTVSHWIE